MPKVRRRLRTGNEKQPTAPLPPNKWQTASYNHVYSPIDRTINDFKISEEEQLALEDLEDEINIYMLHKLAVINNEPQNTFLNIQDHFTVTRVTHTECSNIIYLQVKDAVADTKDTMMEMLHELHQQFIVEQNHKWLLILYFGAPGYECDNVTCVLSPKYSNGSKLVIKSNSRDL